MTDALAASIVDAVLGLELAGTDGDQGNRLSLEGLACGAKDGGLEVTVRKVEATSLRLASGPFTLEVGRVALHQVTGQVRLEGGRPRLSALEAASAELSGVGVRGPLSVPQRDPIASPAPASGSASAAAEGPFSLGPLAAADGTIRAKIVDAHLLFDADVTVPIRGGQVDFNDATVEHVGPDSRMGVSRLGLYVDAPNGRSYLYQFPATPVAGVEYEQRGALLGPWVSQRGRLRLQPFLEGLLRQGPAGPGLGFTEQARLLFDRTSATGEVQLADGKFAAPGVQAELAGRAEGRNVVRIRSEAVGRGLTAEMASLSVRQAMLDFANTRVGLDDINAALVLSLSVKDGQVQFALDVATLRIAGLRADLHRPAGA